MALAPGTRLGPYVIAAQIGAGGMGEVYRATDTNLKRSVAIKVLPDALAFDATRLARFQREAEVLAALNHPNIAHIYGLETTSGQSALVMELVEGPTLANRLAQGPLAIDEALTIARQVVEGLDAAHERGIIHRDLKPSNVAVRDDGIVKILDFGLSRVMEPGDLSTASSPPSSVTMSAITQPGLILGTPAYMSPEQGRGKPVDRRSDIWGFGCLLFEMLTGRSVFGRATQSDSIAAVLEQQPSWDWLPAATPPSVRRLLHRCLEKDPQRRLRDIADARIDIEDAVAHDPPRAAGNKGPRRSIWVTLLIAIAAVLAWLVMTRLNSITSPANESRLEITTPPTDDPLSFAISPDGQKLVFVALVDGQPHLWLRAFDALDPRVLMGTVGAHDPFWSPDNRSVGFFADQKLKRIDLESGLISTLTDAPYGRGGAWSEEDVVLFVPNSTAPLHRVAAGGGSSTPVTALGDRNGSHRYPQFLPGGHHFLFHAQGGPDTTGIYIGSLDSPATRRLIPAASSGAYFSPGWLLFSEQGTLVARAFDLESQTLTGPPVRVAEQVGDVESFAPGFSTSRTGVIAYRTTRFTGTAAPTQLTWFDRSGTMQGIAGEVNRYAQRQPQISPNGREIAVGRRLGSSDSDLWLLDNSRAAKFTLDAEADEAFAVWSPDGNRIVYASRKAGLLDIHLRQKGGESAEVLLDSQENEVPTAWSPDGQFVLYNRMDRSTGMDIWKLPMSGTRTPSVFLQSRFQEHGGQFSPEGGHWVAYQSNESGRYEIYVCSFPDAAVRLPVSVNGGISPRWSRNGAEIFYVAPDATLMAVSVSEGKNGLSIGSPAALFRTRIVGGGSPPGGIDFEYDVAPDGRFLINIDSAPTASITIVQNWKAGAK